MITKQKQEIINRYKTVDARLAVENIIYIVDKVLDCYIRNLDYPYRDIRDVATSIGDDIEYLANKVREIEGKQKDQTTKGVSNK